MQQALIVDDSKTARIVLSKMLSKHRFAVTSLESAEEALDYLRYHHPNVIFMDHMMPGMDGFDAVKAIKSDPDKSSIPIVMHTTKQGDMYIGQAKALGAADILSKPANDHDLTELFDRLHVEDESEQPSLNIKKPRLISEEGELIEYSVNANPSAASSPLSSTASNVEAGEAALPPAASDNGLAILRLKWILAVCLCACLYLTWLYTSAEERLELTERQQQALYETLSWSLNEQDAYDYGELPMAGRRLAILQDLLPQLQGAGFQGSVRIEGHVGAFCLSDVVLDSGVAISVPAPSDLPISACTRIGSSAREALQQSVQQSEEFTRYLAVASERYPQISISVVARGEESPAVTYPDSLDQITAGDWNSVALENNRVSFEITP